MNRLRLGLMGDFSYIAIECAYRMHCIRQVLLQTLFLCCKQMAINSEKEKQALFCSLIEEHSEYLFTRAKRYFASKETAEDLVHDTFLAAFEGIEQFERRSSYRTWLTAILKYKICNRIKVQQKEKTTELANNDQELYNLLFDQDEHWRDAPGPISWDVQPDKLSEQKEFLTILQTCLTHVPQLARQIFLLREVEGFSRNEIAELLSLQSSNIGVMLHRARLSLQFCIQKNWLSGEPS